MPVAPRQPRTGRAPLVAQRMNFLCPPALFANRASGSRCPPRRIMLTNASESTSTPTWLTCFIASPVFRCLVGSPVLAPLLNRPCDADSHVCDSPRYWQRRRGADLLNKVQALRPLRPPRRTIVSTAHTEPHKSLRFNIQGRCSTPLNSTKLALFRRDPWNQ